MFSYLLKVAINKLLYIFLDCKRGFGLVRWISVFSEQVLKFLDNASYFWTMMRIPYQASLKKFYNYRHVLIFVQTLQTSLIQYLFAGTCDLDIKTYPIRSMEQILAC